MKTKIAVVSLLVALAIVGGYLFPRSTEKTIVQSFGAVGDTNSTARIAQCVLDLSTTTPTAVGGVSCLTNGDSRDRIISSVEFYLYAVGSTTSAANWTFKLSTSTGIYVPSSANYVLNTSVSTSTNILYVASSTPGVTGLNTANDSARIWAAGTNLNLLENVINVGNTGAGSTGTMVVKYFISQ